MRALRLRERPACFSVCVGVAAAGWSAVVPAFAQAFPVPVGVDTGRTKSAPAPPSPAGSRDDVVESIVPDGSQASQTRLAGPPVRAESRPERSSPNRTQIAGWARESLEWLLLRGGFRRGSASPFDVPHDRLISRTQLLARASHLRGGWFEATVSGVLGYTLREQGPSGTAAFDGVNGQATNADTQLELRELYIGLFSKRVDFRVGQQRVAWGRADVQSPNDVLNARDLRDPILAEPELRHIPTPLVRVDFDLGALTLELVGTPVFVPDVYDVYGTNWAAIQQDAPPPVKGLLSSVSTLFDSSKVGALNALLRDTQSPASNWTEPSGGAKLSTVIAGMDFDAYYHYGFDTTPFVSVSPSFARFLGMANFQTFRPSDLTPILQDLDAGIRPFSATYVRRHHVGIDLAATAGPLVLRLDAAYDTNRVYYHKNATSFASPAVLGVASVEYQTGDIEKVILVEVSYDRILDPLDGQLLGYDQNSVGVAGTLRLPLGGGVAIDLRALAGIEPLALAAQPGFRLKLNDSVYLKVGALILGGQEESFGWYFRRNSSAFVQAKYSF